MTTPQELYDETKTRLDLNIAKGELANLRCKVIKAKPTLKSVFLS